MARIQNWRLTNYMIMSEEEYKNHPDVADWSEWKKTFFILYM